MGRVYWRELGSGLIGELGLIICHPPLLFEERTNGTLRMVF